MLTKNVVKHIAHLARLELSDVETEKFTQQLGSILKYATMLNEVDTDDVEPISQVTALTTVTFADEVQVCEVTKKLLKQSPQPLKDNMIQVKNIFND